MMPDANADDPSVSQPIPGGSPVPDPGLGQSDQTASTPLDTTPVTTPVDPLSAPSTDPGGTNNTVYTVADGDTLSSIAESHNTSVAQLQSLNPQIADPNLIFPGQSIQLAGDGAAAPSDTSLPSPIEITSPEQPASDTADASLGSASDTAAPAESSPEPVSFPSGSLGAEAEKALGGDVIPAISDSPTETLADAPVESSDGGVDPNSNPPAGSPDLGQ